MNHIQFIFVDWMNSFAADDPFPQAAKIAIDTLVDDWTKFAVANGRYDYWVPPQLWEAEKRKLPNLTYRLFENSRHWRHMMARSGARPRG
jgi:hypothetical protein